MTFLGRGKSEEQFDRVISRIDKVENDISEITKTNLHIDEKFNDVNNKQQELFDNDVALKKELIYWVSEQKKLEEKLKIIIDEQRNVIKDYENEKSAKNNFSDEISVEDMCKYLRLPKLDATSFRYYLHDIGLMDLKINKYRNTYSVSDSYFSEEHDIKEHIHVHNKRVITFYKSALSYFEQKKSEIIESVDKYYRQLDQFNKSKDNIAQAKSLSYIEELHGICGISKTDNYNGYKWGLIYKEYSKLNPNWEKNYFEYKNNWIEEHPDYDDKAETNKEYPLTKLKYIISHFNDGDILLRIACELYIV